MITLDKRNAVNVFITSDFVHLQILWGSLYLSVSLKSKINISAREGLHLASLSLLFGLCTPVVMGNLSVVFGGFVSVKGEKRKCLCDLDSFKWRGWLFLFYESAKVHKNCVNMSVRGLFLVTGGL